MMKRRTETSTRYLLHSLPALATAFLLALALPTVTHAQCGGAAVAGDFRSFQDGNWTQAGTWETFDGANWGPASSAPDGSTTGQVTVCAPHAVTLPISISFPFTLGGRLHVEAGATVATFSFFLANLVFQGTEIINDGTIESILTLDGSVNAAQTLGGSACLTVPRLRFINGTTTTLLNDTVFRPRAAVVESNLQIDNASQVNLDGFTLTFDGTDVPGASFGNSGVLAGPGTFETQNDVLLEGPGSINVAVNVLSGATTLRDLTVAGPFTVANGVTLTSGRPLGGAIFAGDVTIAGTLTTEQASTLTFSGGTFTNTGSVDVNLNSRIDFSGGAQTLAGAGSWTGIGEIEIKSGSTTTLADDLDLDGTLDLSVVGTLVLNAHTLTFGGGSHNFTVQGMLSNPGQVRSLSSALQIATAGTNTFDAPLTVVAGQTTLTHNAASYTFSKPITVEAGATLATGDSRSYGYADDLTIAGTFATSQQSTQNFSGGTFTNIGAVVLNVGSRLNFSGGAQTLTGAGSWTGSGEVAVTSGAITLSNNVTFGGTIGLALESGGELVLPDPFTLSVTGAPVTGNAGSRLSGTGTLDYTGQTFSSSGTVAPGTSPGLLSLVGAYSHNADAILEIEFQDASGPGTGFDVLAVDGDVTLGGTLNVTATGPIPFGDYPILTFTGTLTGTFATVNLPPDAIVLYPGDFGGQPGQVLLHTGPVLPVELVAFEAVADGADVVLAWQTASETNNAGFEVHSKSAEADLENGEADWQVVSFVEGHGTTLEAQRYTYRVADLAPGSHRFRLKQLDFDGTFEYSPEVEVHVEMPEAFVLTAPYPNPFNPEARFSLMVKRRQRVEVAVYDALGRRVRMLYEGELEAAKARAFIFEAGSLPSGLYLVRAVGETFTATRRVVLLR